MFGIGLQELIIILVIVLILFGGKNIPELSRSLASGIKELRKGFTDSADAGKSKSDDKKTAGKDNSSDA